VDASWPAVGPRGDEAELGNPSALADDVTSDQRETPRAPARQGQGREPAHGQDDDGAGLRAPLSQAAAFGLRCVEPPRQRPQRMDGKTI